MAHINEEIAFTAGIFVVRDAKTLMIRHRESGQCLATGEHSEFGISHAAAPHA